MRNSFLFISLTMLAIVSCNHEPQHKEEAATYAVSIPEKKDTVINREFIAQIRAYQHVELRALEEGYLQKIYVDEGQFVKKGQLLFQLLPTIYQAETAKARAEKAEAEAELSRTEIEFQNTKLLADSNIVSQRELALAKANLNKAKANVDKLHASLKLSNVHLQFTEIRAPFDGIVGRFNDVRQGSLLEEGELLTTLSDNSKMWVYFNVPEAVYLDFVRNKKDNEDNQKVHLQLADGGDFNSIGIVETIESDFNNETGNIAFRATFQNPKSILRHGQTGKILMPAALNNALLIPQKATFEVLEKKFVYVVKHGNIEAREISVNTEMPHLYEIAKGLTAKDTILVDGLRKVKQGDRIKGSFVSLQALLKNLNNIKAE